MRRFLENKTSSADFELSLEAAVNDFELIDRELTALESIQDSIIKNGFNKQIALEAERILPSHAIGSIYFSNKTNSQKLQIALEEMSGKLIAGIIALIAAGIAVIYKVIKWITGGSSSSGGGSGGIS